MTVAFGILCFGFMPNTPAESRFLTEEERDHALRRMRLDASGSSSIDVDDEKFNWHWVKMALLAPQTYLFSFLWFCLLVSLHSFSLFLPSIISVMGYEAMIAQLLTAPPNIAGFISVIASSYLSDRTKIRGPFIAGGSLLGIVGYTMLLVSDRNPVRYAGTFFIAIGVYQCSALMMVRSHSLACPLHPAIVSVTLANKDRPGSRAGRPTISRRITCGPRAWASSSRWPCALLLSAPLSTSPRTCKLAWIVPCFSIGAGENNS